MDAGWGLCSGCIHGQRVESAKGSAFLLGRKGLKDPARFPKYPHLPVRKCGGFVRIRGVLESDFPAIQSIYAYWVLHGTATFEIDPPDVDELKARHAAIAARQLPYLVAESEAGKILGYAYAAVYRPRPAYRFTVEDSIYLHPDAAGQGIGKALLMEVVSICASQGYQQMIAIVGGGLANEGSVNLHLKCGFTHAGLLKNVGYKFSGWHDTAILQRGLST
jgi:L-amino acid N-acyltransferase YncA